MAFENTQFIASYLTTKEHKKRLRQRGLLVSLLMCIGIVFVCYTAFCYFLPGKNTLDVDIL